MNWDAEVNTVYLDPSGTKVRKKVSAREIIRDPNRHQFESVLSAICICLNQLAEVEEIKLKNISMLADKINSQGVKK